MHARDGWGVEATPEAPIEFCREENPDGRSDEMMMALAAPGVPRHPSSAATANDLASARSAALVAIAGGAGAAGAWELSVRGTAGRRAGGEALVTLLSAGALVAVAGAGATAFAAGVASDIRTLAGTITSS